MVCKAVSIALALDLILTYKSLKQIIMKSITLKKIIHIAMVSSVIIASIMITKNSIHNVKYLYGLEPTGSGVTCFFDMIQ